MKRLQGIVIGMIISAMLSGVVAYAAPGTIEVLFDNIKIKINGTEIKSDTEPFTYNDRTYVPLRAVAENMGADVYWDDATNTVSIYDSRNEKISDYYDSIFLLGSFSSLSEISEYFEICRAVLTYEVRGSYVYDKYYESFKTIRDSFNKMKPDWTNIANSIIKNSMCYENAEAANKLLSAVTLLEENVNLLSDLYVTYDVDKDMKFSDNLYSIRVNSTDARNAIYEFANK